MSTVSFISDTQCAGDITPVNISISEVRFSTDRDGGHSHVNTVPQ